MILGKYEYLLGHSSFPRSLKWQLLEGEVIEWKQNHQPQTPLHL